MTKDYSSREIEATAVDTKTAATTLGSSATPGVLNVPKDASELEGVIVSMGCDYVAAGSATALIRLEGGGLPGGPYVLAAGAVGGESTTGNSHLTAAKRIPLGVPVKPGNEVLIAIEMCGEDVGSIHCGVTLQFKTGATAGGNVKGVVTVEGDIADDAVSTPISTQGSTAAPSRQVPSDARVIKTLIAAVSPDIAADGACGFMVKLGGKGVKEGEQQIFIAGAGGTAVQAGADPDGLAMNPFILEDADIAVIGGNTIDIDAELCGDDVGDAHIVVTLIFA